MAATETKIKQIAEKLDTLSPKQLDEVKHYIDFLLSREVDYMESNEIEIAVLREISAKIRNWRDLGLSFAEMQQKKRKLLIEKGYPEDWDTVFFDQELWAIERAIAALSVIDARVIDRVIELLKNSK